MQSNEITNILILVAIGLAVACLVKIHRLENTVQTQKAARRDRAPLTGRGKLVDWPNRRPPQPRHHR